MSLLFCLCVFCDSFLCSISLLLLSDYLSCILNSVLYTVWVQNFEGSIFRGFEESSLIRNFRGYKFSWQ